jgi:hypothetical protein
MEWQPIATAPESTTVLTKIDDENGCRNEQQLKRQGRLWFIPDMSMYVYYTPTHWRALAWMEQAK